MAEEAEVEPHIEEIDDTDESTPGYKPPAHKTIDEIQSLDQDDESLVKYKQQLLAGADNVEDEGGPNVLVKKMLFRTEGRDDIELDLTGELSTLKDKPITIKEGVSYRIVVAFRVQREIVAGMKYSQVSSRKGIKVDKSNVMVGSYGPKTEIQEYRSKPEDAPKGMIARGHYTVKSKFIDDDKNVIKEWDWSFNIAKDW